MSEPQAVVRQPGDGRIVSLGVAGDVSLKVERASSNGTMSAYEFAVPPRTAGPPLHIHRSWDELFYVLDGEMTFLIEGETHVAPAGSCVFIPRGKAHTFWNAAGLPARQLTVFTPSGIEDYFDAVSATLDSGRSESLDEARALMEQHDMVLPDHTGPAYGAMPDTPKP